MSVTRVAVVGAGVVGLACAWELAEAGADVVVLGHFRGTHGGDLVSPGGTIPASGNDLNLRFIDYFKVENGVIVDHQTVFDQMEMLGQLGALPPA